MRDGQKFRKVCENVAKYRKRIYVLHVFTCFYMNFIAKHKHMIPYVFSTQIWPNPLRNNSLFLFLIDYHVCSVAHIGFITIDKFHVGCRCGRR